MQADNPDKEESDRKSRKKLVRILIIVGIGIPVLIELMTLFNLINVQIFENDEEPNRQSWTADTEVQKFVEGDTLFADQSRPLVIDMIKARVSAQEWRFALQLTNPDTSQLNPEVRIDSLELQSGKILDIQKKYDWNADGKVSSFMDEWKLPSGDIPVILYISSEQPVSGDSIQFVQQEVRLGNIPVRYSRD